MLNQLNYKNKTLLVVAASVLFLLLGWNTSISKTLDIYSSYQEQLTTLEKAAKAPEKLRKLNQELSKIESSFGRKNAEFHEFQDALLNLVIPYSNQNKLKIVEINEAQKANEKGYQIQTVSLRVSGSFKAITLLIDEIQHSSLGRLCSVDYELKKNRKNKTRYLQGTIYIQNFKKN